MSSQSIAIGSRGSPLALVQARSVAEALEREGVACRIVVVETQGDRRAPDTAWGEGAFVAAIERALLAGRVDVAVHSAKDVPIDEDPRLRIGAYLPRADPRDALVVRADAEERSLADLRPGSRVGTDSPRRTGFLLARRPDLAVHPLHGNVDTRLRRLDSGQTDALVLACAGLDRLGLGDRIAERLAPEVVPPAPGQGAIAIQIRRDDDRSAALVAAIDDRRTRLAVETERAFLGASGGGCRAPIGALATVTGDELDLLGGYTGPDGSGTTVARRRGAAAAGTALAHELAQALDSRRRMPAPAPVVEPASSRSRAQRVLVTRTAGQSDELVLALRSRGLDPIPVPTIAVDLEPAGSGLDSAARRLGGYGWVVITSANGAHAILDAVRRVRGSLDAPRWAAIGQVTRTVLEQEGVVVDFQPRRADSSAIAVELPIVGEDRVLLVRGDLADDRLAVGLRARGAVVDDVVAYRTREAPEGSRELLRRALAGGPIDAIVFTSGSTVRGLVTLARAESLVVASILSICIGPGTAATARAAGFQVLGVSEAPDAATLANTTTRALGALMQEIR